MPKGEISCIGCPLEHLGKGFVITSDGNGDLPIMLIGEALGEEEVAANKQFVGAAGKTLNRLIERTKDPDTNVPLRREQFTVANIIGCQPPGNELTNAPYEHGAINHCRPNLESAINKFKSKHPNGVLVPLGNQPMRWLTGEWGIEHWRGSVLESQYGWVVPTFHPSYIMRGKFNLAQVVVHDILRALHIAKYGVINEKPDFLEDPTLAVCNAFMVEWIRLGCPDISSDIETNYSEGEDETDLEELSREDDASYIINRIAFSYSPLHAISVPWSEPYISWAQAMFDHAQTVVWWNANFDVPRLKASNIKFHKHLKHVDAMHMHHFLQPAIPYNLQFASSIYVGNAYCAWKHTSKLQPAWYSCRDVDYTIRCYHYLIQELKKSGKEATFDAHFTRFMAVLSRMSDRGVASDRAIREDAKRSLTTMFDLEVAGVQGYIPIQLKPKKVFKISKERLEKKFGELGLDWIEVEEELTTKEEARAAVKEAKRLAKLAEKANKPPRKGRKKKEQMCLLEENS